MWENWLSLQVADIQSDLFKAFFTIDEKYININLTSINLPHVSIKVMI